MEEVTREIRLRLAAALAQRRDDIVGRWIAQVTTDLDVSGVSLTDLRDALPDYLDRLKQHLQTEALTLDASGAAVWKDVAREHALTRVRLGFDINQLVHEFIVLRRILHEVAEEEGVFADRRPAILAELLEAAIAVAVKSYVDARDYDARRVQAANIGFITHELRNPLNAAMLATARLRRLATADQAHFLDIVERSQGRLSQLIDGVLETERFDAGHVQSRPIKVKLREVLQEAVSTAAAAAEQKGLNVIAHYDPDLEMEIDPVLTRSAVQNLMDNAVKYTDQGRVTLTVEDLGSDVVIHVRDNCPGLSPAELATIFEPFVRGSSPHEGTGLGLAIARRAIGVQGGHVDVESAGERGCHFWITLPKRPAAPLHSELNP
jgi:signal transduction histidine kinase